VEKLRTGLFAFERTKWRLNKFREYQKMKMKIILLLNFGKINKKVFT